MTHDLRNTPLVRAWGAVDVVVAAAPVALLRAGEDADGASALLARLGVGSAAVLSDSPGMGWGLAPADAPDRIARRAGLATRPVWLVPQSGDEAPRGALLILGCDPEFAARAAWRSRLRWWLWLEAGAAPELRLTVPDLALVASRQQGPDHLAEHLCLSAEDEALWLSLRRQRALAPYPRMAGMFGFPTPESIDGLAVAGIDVKPRATGGTVVGGPLQPVPWVTPLRLDPPRGEAARAWLAAIGWEAAEAALSDALGA